MLPLHVTDTNYLGGENMNEYDYEDLEINLIAFITYCFIILKNLKKPKLKEEK